MFICKIFFGGNAIFSIAAYNAGQGTVLNAIKGNAFKGEATDFWSLPLSKQTQMYIPRLYALAEMIAHPEKYPLDMPPIPNKPYLTQVDVGSQIDLAKAAELSGLTLKQLKSLNPGFNRWATSPDGPYLLTVPVEHAEELRNGLALLPQGHRVTWERYNVKAGDSLTSIAKKHDTSVALLQQINKMDTSLLHVGDVIFIPKSSSTSHLSSVSSPIPDVASSPATTVVKKASVKNVSKQEENNAEIVYIVRKGDTLTSVAKALNVSWKTLREYNHLSSPVLNIGQKLHIPPPAKSKNSIRSSGGSQKIRYTVQKGDSLSKIALRFGVSVQDIERWNPAVKASPILQPHQKLVIYQS
ncbi:MAG: LysM peptidoglycan-binding domain-containing protein [Gammaproteobacteria bacterium]|nr:LysM peptidoglycan-binding domain-containing protein [Gammaproteobacteria bacterium]